jgi:LytS/YehU family sensor histidine kinase
LLLQPLVENAIKHAIAHAEEGGVIRVTAALHDSCINIRVADSGPDDRQNTSAGEGAGVGLQNIRDRLLMRYGDKAALSIDRADIGGLEVLLVLPVQDARQ